MKQFLFVWRVACWIASAFGAGARAFIALVGILGVVAALANYAITQGSGTNFGSIVVSTVHYAQQLLCDPATPSQCASVSPGGSVSVMPSVASSGGMTTFFVQPAASDNHQNIKSSGGQVYYILGMNNSATVNYLRLYNAGAAFNGCNSATGLVTQVQIPASTAVGGITIPLPFPIPFSAGISICVTSGYATNDTTPATASAMSVTIGYN